MWGYKNYSRICGTSSRRFVASSTKIRCTYCKGKNMLTTIRWICSCESPSSITHLEACARSLWKWSSCCSIQSHPVFTCLEKTTSENWKLFETRITRITRIFSEIFWACRWRCSLPTRGVWLESQQNKDSARILTIIPVSGTLMKRNFSSLEWWLSRESKSFIFI
jgi:hypothetical protein